MQLLPVNVCRLCYHPIRNIMCYERVQFRPDYKFVYILSQIRNAVCFDRFILSARYTIPNVFSYIRSVIKKSIPVVYVVVCQNVVVNSHDPQKTQKPHDTGIYVIVRMYTVICNTCLVYLF